MVPTDHDIPFSRTFQGLLRYIFKDFSRTFLCSFKHPFAKKWSTMEFTNKTYRDHLILSSPEKWWGGGRLGYVFLTLLDDLLYYGYNAASNNSAWKGGLGVLPQKIFIRIRTKSCNSRQFSRVHELGYYATIRVETVHFETDWYIETHIIYINTCRYSGEMRDMITIVL